MVSAHARERRGECHIELGADDAVGRRCRRNTRNGSLGRSGRGLGTAAVPALRGGIELTERDASCTVARQENERLDSLVGTAGGISGFFRPASFSSCLRSVLVPANGGLLRDNARLSCWFIKAEVHELQDLLTTPQDRTAPSSTRSRVSARAATTRGNWGTRARRLATTR